MHDVKNLGKQIGCPLSLLSWKYYSISWEYEISVPSLDIKLIFLWLAIQIIYLLLNIF